MGWSSRLGKPGIRNRKEPRRNLRLSMQKLLSRSTKLRLESGCRPVMLPGTPSCGPTPSVKGSTRRRSGQGRPLTPSTPLSNVSANWPPMTRWLGSVWAWIRSRLKSRPWPSRSPIPRQTPSKAWRMLSFRLSRRGSWISDLWPIPFSLTWPESPYAKQSSAHYRVLYPGFSAVPPPLRVFLFSTVGWSAVPGVRGLTAFWLACQPVSSWSMPTPAADIDPCSRRSTAAHVFRVVGQFLLVLSPDRKAEELWSRSSINEPQAPTTTAWACLNKKGQMATGLSESLSGIP